MFGETDENRVTDVTTVTPSDSLSTQRQNTKTGLNYQRQITIAFYAVTLAFCLITNIILNYLIFTRKFMRIKYIFTASISISHILICVTAVPLAISVLATENGDVDTRKIACDVITCFCVGVTSQSMLTTAIRRCLAISERFRHANFTYRGKVKSIALIWIFALATSFPYIFKDGALVIFSFVSNGRHLSIFDEPISILSMNISKTNVIIDLDGDISRNTSYMLQRPPKESEIHPNKTESTTIRNTSKGTTVDGFYVYNIVTLFLQIVIPCIAALVLQTVTLIGLKRRPNQIHWIKEILITKQHICMAVVFLVCWLPLSIANLVVEDAMVPGLVFHILQPFALSSIVYFPIIYYILNAHIKREFLLFIQRITNR